MVTSGRSGHKQHHRPATHPVTTPAPLSLGSAPHPTGVPSWTNHIFRRDTPLATLTTDREESSTARAQMALLRPSSTLHTGENAPPPPQRRTAAPTLLARRGSLLGLFLSLVLRGTLALPHGHQPQLQLWVQQGNGTRLHHEVPYHFTVAETINELQQQPSSSLLTAYLQDGVPLPLDNYIYQHITIHPDQVLLQAAHDTAASMRTVTAVLPDLIARDSHSAGSSQQPLPVGPLQTAHALGGPPLYTYRRRRWKKLTNDHLTPGATLLVAPLDIQERAQQGLSEQVPRPHDRHCAQPDLQRGERGNNGVHGAERRHQTAQRHPGG